MPCATPANPLPPRPRAVLRLGFAGRRELAPASEAHLRLALGRILAVMGRRLAALTPGVPTAADSAPKVAAFFARRPPLLRLVTGLCEGADTIAAQVLEGLTIPPDGQPATGTSPPCLETELAAVLPFDLPAYRDSRSAGFRPEFDRQAARCAYILALDGLYAKPDPHTPLAAARRTKGYRAQSAVLLRHADILIAAADPDAPGKAGGTLETVQAALVFELPVVFIHTGSGAVWLIAPGDDLASTLAEPPPADLDDRLAHLVSWLVAEPDLQPDADLPDRGHTKARRPGLRLLHEYFGDADLPPLKVDRAGQPQRKASLREWVWTRLERRFRKGPKPIADAPLKPYAEYRARATGLNYHYSGLYRGAYVLNYVLAVLAVALATLSLVLIGATPHAAWLNPALLGLGTVKLAILSFIAANTRRTNREDWNDQAVDYRYLAERLRALFYLPRAGSFQPPAAARPYHAARAERQSAVDWLFDAITRAVSPAEQARLETHPGHDGAGDLRIRVLRPAPTEALTLVRGPWVTGQVAYHARTALTLERMDRFAERAGAWLNWTVVAVVAVDIAILLLYLVIRVPGIADLLTPDLAEPLHHLAHELHGHAPWLLFLAAVLPAAVASLNGLRFQGESARLAERSAMLRLILGGRPRDALANPPEITGGRGQQAADLLDRIERAQSDPATDPGAWSLDTLRLTERIADDCVREVGEWSVLYAKELPET